MLSGFLVHDLRARKSAVVCDNAHSLDLQSWTSLRSVFRALEKNVLLLLGLRPNTKDDGAKAIATWFISTPRTLCLRLAELSKSNTSALACAVFQVSAIPRPLTAAIFEKCRGHPRFILEISELLLSEEKVVVEGGTCRVERDDYENLKLPNNIRAVFISRIDRLSSSEQITLKVASVIGPIFSLTLIVDVYPSGANKLQIADDMASLLRENLVQT